ncbi:STAS domain-containing protein [Marinitoga aeolica]|uniref:Anti-sigma factor antagonist n=1 Tax=Marinitoga aeolica TaxID=2809031 RepID=A0ABY8PRN7_9BACT|nr:STAS domain-containing protein [Marinitoga aeolica]WGS65285.1 STAS domain-containing protein [Marinitoga aeolica]
MNRYCIFNEENNIKILRFLTNITVENSGYIKERLEKFLSFENKEIIIDFSDVYFIDSNGLGVIISLIQRARKYNNRLIFINVNSLIKNILDITKVNRLMNILDTYEEAKKYAMAL